MALLQYDFRAVGVENVMRAMRSVEARAMQSMRRIGHEAGRVRVAGTPMATAARAAGPGGRGSRISDTARGFDQIGRAARAAELRRAREEIAIVNRTARQRIRIAERTAAAEGRAYAQAQRREAANRQRFARSTVGVAGRSVGGSVRAIGGLAGGALALGGGFAVANAIQSEKTFKGASAALANQAYGTGGETRTRLQIQKDVEATASEVGISSGLGKENVVGMLRQFAAISGNVKAGEKMSSFMGKVASATDASPEDVGRTGGQILQALGTRYDLSKQDQLDKALVETQDIMLSMAGQAKVGSIEFNDLATQMGKVMSASGRFAGGMDDIAKTMGAVAQLSIAGGASSPEEAMTSIMRFADDLVGNAKRFEKQGINVWADKGKTKLRGPEEVLFDVLGKTKGDLSKVSKLFGIRSMKAFEPFQQVYTAAGGGDAGMKEVRRVMDTMKGAKMTTTELDESAAFRGGQADRQFARAAEEFKNAIGKELLPVITKLVPEFARMIPQLAKAAEALGKFIGYLTDKPLSTIGAVIAAKLVADIAAAGIGSKVSAAIVAAMAGGGKANAAATAASVAAGGAGGGAVKAGAMAGALGVAKATGIAGLITGVGHLGVGMLDEQLGLKKHGLSAALPGRTEDGGFSYSQLGKDALTSLIPGGGAIKAAPAVVRSMTEMGFRGRGAEQAPLERGVGAGGASEADRALKEFAASLAKANAELAKTSAPNRGNTPSPVKG